MKISDKELDDLFSSKLNDLEVEPGEMVWSNISEQISIKPKKKSIVPILRIAASIIVVVSVGLMLLQKNDEPVKKSAQHKIAKTEIKIEKPLTAQIESVKPDEPVLLLSAKNKVVKEIRSNKISNKKPELILVQKTVPELRITDQSLAVNNQLEKKAEPTVAALVTARTAVVPDISTHFGVKTDEEETITETVKPQILAAKNSTPAVATKRKGIRSIGDMVNLVMAKVDKRQDKLIEFTDSEDGDESNVTGINLGIITIKKEK